jgi:hypothetical protein
MIFGELVITLAIPERLCYNYNMGTKKFYLSKTFWFAILFGLVSVAGISGYGDYTPSQDTTEIVNVVVAVVFLILRFITKKGVEF